MRAFSLLLKVTVSCILCQDAILALWSILMPALIVDSDFRSLHDAVRGLEFPEEIRKTLALVTVQYLSFDGLLHQGQVVLHGDLADDVENLFESFIGIGFQIYQAAPVCAYGWNDDESMAANNSSAFNYRLILGTDRLSNHSFGRALDLNPVQNPYFARDGRVYPDGAAYNLGVPGTVTPEVVALFKEKGWIWGGDWTVPVDYQHFEKPV